MGAPEEPRSSLEPVDPIEVPVAPPVEESSFEPRRSPWRVLLIAAFLVILVVMAIFLPPLLHLGKYRHSITASMSDALGRPVYVGGMQLRLLPTPGFVMSDFTVAEDPAFGYEPALHASSVVASLRLTSLWRGRLEVSRISLDEANLNLVRNSAGQWSIASVLLRASQIPNGPTGEPRRGPHPRFPYIEATNARIDFKEGAEKKPLSLMNAEFSMWQASGDEWRVRLRAQPVRTDLELHLSDSGQLTMEGSLHRAATLNAMPVDLRAEWYGAQLGQVSRLMAGVDSGWRGDLDITASITGNAGNPALQSRIRIGDLRRQEFQPATTVDVDATCRSDYLRSQRALNNLTCFWPVAGGHLLLTGSVRSLASPSADLQLEINKIPAAFPVTILGLLRPYAQNVTVTGTVNGGFRLIAADGPVLSGDALATGVRLRYAGGQLLLPPLHFAVPSSQPPQRKTKHAVQPQPQQNVVQLQPFSLAMGEPKPLIVEAQFARSGFQVHLSGQSSLARLIPAAANFGLLENAMAVATPKGRATLDTTTAGNWMRPTSSAGSGIGTSGTLNIDAAELRPTFLPAPVEVDSAEMALTPETISWQDVAFQYQTLAMRGSIQFPALCNQPVACPASFTLAAGTVDAATLEAVFAGEGNNGFLGQLLTNALGNDTAPWPPLNGKIECDGLQLGQLLLRNVEASVAVDGTRLTIGSLDAAALGGTVHATGDMSIEQGSPHWKLALRTVDANAADAAALFGELWGPGSLNAETNLAISGYRTADLVASASGDFSFTWQNGDLPSAGSGSPFANFDRWTAKGTIAQSTLSLTGSVLAHGKRTIPLRGSITFDRDLDLTLETREGRRKAEGTLAQPVMH